MGGLRTSYAIFSISSRLGVPTASHTIYIYSVVLIPARNGFRSSNSANIHPTDHISIDLEYMQLQKIMSGINIDLDGKDTL